MNVLKALPLSSYFLLTVLPLSFIGFSKCLRLKPIQNVRLTFLLFPFLWRICPSSPGCLCSSRFFLSRPLTKAQAFGYFPGILIQSHFCPKWRTRGVVCSSAQWGGAPSVSFEYAPCWKINLGISNILTVYLDIFWFKSASTKLCWGSFTGWSSETGL